MWLDALWGTAGKKDAISQLDALWVTDAHMDDVKRFKFKEIYDEVMSNLAGHHQHAFEALKDAFDKWLVTPHEALADITRMRNESGSWYVSNDFLRRYTGVLNPE